MNRPVFLPLLCIAVLGCARCVLAWDGDAAAMISDGISRAEALGGSAPDEPRAEAAPDPVSPPGARRGVANGFTSDDIDAPRLPVPEDRPTLIVDFPGVDSQGIGRPQQWGPVLTGGRPFQTFNVRHEGSRLWVGQKWQPEPLGSTITVPRHPDRLQLQRVLAPIRDAMGRGDNVYVKVDANATMGAYLAHLKTGELKTAARVADEIVDNVPRHYFVIADPDSMGTDIPCYMRTSQRVDAYVFQSPRDLQHVDKIAVNNPASKVYVVTGRFDLPHWGLGLNSINRPNVTVFDIKSTGPNPALAHSQVASPTTAGVIHVKVPQAPAYTLNGTLGEVVGRSIAVQRAERPSWGATDWSKVQFKLAGPNEPGWGVKVPRVGPPIGGTTAGGGMSRIQAPPLPQTKLPGRR